MQVPETSHEANEKVTNVMLSRHYVIILDCLKKHGLLTFEEISIHSGLEKHQVGRRLLEMIGLELIRKPGSKKMTSTGRNAYQYCLVNANVVVPPLPERMVKGEVQAVDHANYIIAQAEKTKLAVQKSLVPIKTNPNLKDNSKVPSKIFNSNQTDLFSMLKD